MKSLWVVAILLVFGATAWAQVENAAAPGDAAAAAQPAVEPVAVASGNRLPHYPLPFHRGNDASASYQGFYLSLGLFVPVVGLFFLWIRTTQWVDDDSGRLKLRTEFWNSVVFAGGMAGFALIFMLPTVLLGLPALLLAAGTPIGLYVAERNSRVPESGKVLTPRHLTTVANRLLARFGIAIGGGETPVFAGGPPIKFIGKSTVGGESDADRSRQVENSRGYAAAKELIYDSILRRATDVHMEPAETEVAIRIRVDGVMHGGEAFDRDTGQAVVNVFKVLSAMDITERRKPQDGSFRAITSGREIDFRVATQGTRFGEKMSLRILDQGAVVPDLGKLGMPKRLHDRLTRLIHEPHGMVLCCGPTGAGKSTTLYAALTSMDRYQRNVITIEDPIEYKIEGVNQIEINSKAGQTFAGSLRSILRQDPDVVMVGEIRDAETATIGCQAANTGHMVFSTVHANDTITALFRLLELGVEPFMVANSLTALIGQRLVRRLCPDCKEAYKPNPDLVHKAGLPADKVEFFYRPPKTPQEECPTCGGLGYHGRIGVYELLVMTDRIRDLVREKAPAATLKAEARKDGMLSMREEGLRLVARGVTAIDELLRVVK
ncbi:MAG: type II/IV secretion system protein [Planctomycetaceae bacterium]|nr:type II/IV secretion system protein [Planctomycetaceae bacterium]